MEERIQLGPMEGTINFPDRTGNLIFYRVEAITKDASYNVVENLEDDMGILYVKVRITEAFDGTWSLGTDSSPGKFISTANCKKTIGRQYYPMSALTNKGADAGETIKLFMGAGTTGKISMHICGAQELDGLL